MAIKIDEKEFNESLRNVLMTLKDIDPTLERESRKKLRKAGDTLVNHAQGLVPGSPPTGVHPNTNRVNWQTWSGSRNWSRSAVQRGIKIKTSTRRKGDQYRIVTFVQTSAPGVIFDMAGKVNKFSAPTKRGAGFVRALSKYHGEPSRVMWPAYEDKAGVMDAAMVDAVNEMIGEINSRLGGFGAKLAGF